MRRSLDLGGLSDFQPRLEAVPDRSFQEGAHHTDKEMAWPSREPLREGQLNIRADLAVLERFKALCRDDRRTYGAMLEILMDGLEQSSR